MRRARGLTPLGRILQQLVVDPNMTAPVIAAKTGVHVRTVHRHLAQLKRDGALYPVGYDHGRVVHALNMEYQWDGHTIGELARIINPPRTGTDDE